MNQQPPILPTLLAGGDDAPTAPVTGAVSISEIDILQAVGDFLTAILSPGVQIVAGQDNRVPEPAGPDHIIMTVMNGAQLSSTVHYSAPDEQTIAVARSTRVGVQLDVYGPNSFANSLIITTLFRDAYGTHAMGPTGVTPLYCDDGRQMPLIDGEKQYEARWMIQASVQIMPAVVTPAQFADSVTPVLIEADAP